MKQMIDTEADKVSHLIKRLDNLQENQEKFDDQISALKRSAISYEQLNLLEKNMMDADDKLWDNIADKFVGKIEYDALDQFAHLVARKCDAVEKKLNSSQFEMDLNDKRLHEIEKSMIDLRLTKDDHFNDLSQKLSSFSTEIQLLDGKINSLSEHLQESSRNPRSSINQSTVAEETLTKLREEILDDLAVLNGRLQQAEKKIETTNQDVSQRAFFDQKFFKELSQTLKRQVEHCLESVQNLKSLDIPELEKRQSLVETTLLNQERPQHNNIIIDSFQQKVNDMSNSLFKLREQHTLEISDVLTRVENLQKLQNTEIEKHRMRANEVSPENTLLSKLSSLEGKIRDLANDHLREEERISGLAQQQSNLSLKLNEHTQNFNFFQSQTKGYQSRESREESISRDWRLSTEKIIEKCQADLKEFRMFIESHQVGIKTLDDQSESTRQEVLLVKSACAKLEFTLNNVNNDLQVVIDNQNNAFMQKIRETVDALDSTTDRFMSALREQARKTDERFNRLDDNISNLLRNSFHLSRSLEEEEEEKGAVPSSRRLSPRTASYKAEKQSFPYSQPREIQESRSSQPEGYHGRLITREIQESKRKIPSEEGHRGRFSEEIPLSSQQEGYQGRLGGVQSTISWEDSTKKMKDAYRGHEESTLDNQFRENQLRSQNVPSYSQITLPMKTSLLQPQSHQQLLSLLPPSSTILSSSTSLQQSMVHPPQPQQQTASTIARESASEGAKKTGSTGALKMNIVADLHSSKNRPKRL